MKIRTGILTLAAAAALGAAAQAPVAITATTDSAVILMGSQFRLTVDLAADQTDSIRLVNAPEIPDPQQNYSVYGPVVITAAESDTAVSNNRRTIHRVYTLQGFDPGLYTLPRIGAVRAPGDTVWAALQSLKVLPMDVDTVTMAARPLAGVASPNCRWYDYIPLWTLWVLLALAIAGGIFMLVAITRKRKVVLQEKASRPIPPYELAVMSLERLRQSGITAPGHEKEFYTELTDILRKYLHGRFGINAMEMTSSQIVKALRANPDTRMPGEQVKEVLEIADFVKFAKEKPLADDNVRSLQRATDFVQSTKPLPPPPAPANSKSKPSTKNTKK